MRPRELVLRGFRSYSDETRFEFSDRSLVGIVGPIGSGKTSILDAISFAIFGKTPRISSDTKSLINQRHDALHVSLTFEVDGEAWKVVRSLRRGGASAHALYRVEGDEEVEVADRAREITATMETLLGMDFEAFQRSVLLAQNQFSGFLDATPTDRNKVLKGVFGFDRLDSMRDRLKGRLDVIGAQLQGLASRRASAESDRKDLEEKRKALEVAETRSGALEALRGSVGQVDDTLRDLEAKSRSAAETLVAIDALADQIPSREDTDGLFAGARESQGKIEKAESLVREAADAVTTAAGGLETLEAEAGGRAALQEAGDLVAGLAGLRSALASAEDRLARAREQAEKDAAEFIVAQERQATATSEASRAGTVVAERVAAESAAQEGLHTAHSADRAGSLRATLEVGMACPVCEQPVESLPEAIGDAGVAAAEEALESARTALAEARAQEAEATSAAARAGAEVNAAGARVEQGEKAVTAAQVDATTAGKALQERLDTLSEKLGASEPEERLEELRTGLRAAEDRLKAARAEEAKARSSLDEVTRDRATLARQLDGLRSSLQALAGRLGAEVAIDDDVDSIEIGLAELRERWVQGRAGASEAAEEAKRALTAGRQARAELLEGAGLAATDDIVEVATEAAKEATALGAEVRMLEKRLEELAALGAEEAEVVEQRELLERLHGDLAPSRFLEFVLTERRQLLADLAGVHLETLTAGRYRFSEEGAFDLVDLAAAEAVRSAASLSGGETFLASLALALALAEIVAREGGRLDSFFLDEGFGSLDPEHLDLAMDGIERLVASGGDRLVVIVSHVPALRDRIEDLIVLDRDDVTGDTRVLAGAGM